MPSDFSTSYEASLVAVWLPDGISSRLPQGGTRTSTQLTDFCSGFDKVLRLLLGDWRH